MAFFNLIFGNTYPHIYSVMNEDYTEVCKIVSRLRDAAKNHCQCDADSVEKQKVCQYLVNSLCDKVRTNFENEEGLMKNYNYPFLRQHAMDHLVLIRTIENIQLSLRNGAALTLEAILILKEWLVRHIGVADNHLAVFLSSCKDKRTVKRRDLSARGGYPLALAFSVSDTVSPDVVCANRLDCAAHEERIEDRVQKHDVECDARITDAEQKRMQDRIWYE